MGKDLSSSPDLKAIHARVDATPGGPWFLSDCEGELKIWREAVLRGVTRDETGAITGYRDPLGWRPGDLIAEWDLDTWDPGADDDDDRIRAIAEFITQARTDIPALLAKAVDLTDERDQLKRGGKELGGIVTHLSELIKDAWTKSATDPIAALHILGNHLAEALPNEDEIDGFNATYRALEKHRANVGELQGRVDELVGQVAGRDETIQRARDEHPRAEVLDENDEVCGYVCGGCLDINGNQAVPWPCSTMIAIDGDPADDGSQK